ncbi:MAG: hypothetical protein M1831_003190 [Alyxoria varia]|nr:MAG: hypothetical protein M1831_003190 [Alyxoria varia]
MPPRKRARLTSSISTPDASSNASPPAIATHKSNAASPTTLRPPPSTPRPTTGSRNHKDNKKRKLEDRHDPISIAENTLLDAWTPTQESALFKLLIHNKPTGLHKHMHMLSIFQALRSQGHVHAPTSPSLTPAPPLYNVPAPEEAPATSTRGALSKNQSHQQAASQTLTQTPEEEAESKTDSTTVSIKPSHLRIPALWQKLASLYDLDALDERENSWRFSNMRYDSEGGVLAADEEAEQTPTAKNTGRRRAKTEATVPVLSEQELWPPGCKEFSLGGPLRHGDGGDGGFAVPMDPEAQELSHRMFARRLKSPDASPSPSPPPPVHTTTTKAESRGSKVTPASASVPSSSPPAASTRRNRASTINRRQSLSAGGAGGRRGSKASASAVTASSEIPDSEQGTEANEVKDEDADPAHSTRGASARRSMRGVAAKEKQENETKGRGKSGRKK